MLEEWPSNDRNVLRQDQLGKPKRNSFLPEFSPDILPRQESGSNTLSGCPSFSLSLKAIDAAYLVSSQTVVEGAPGAYASVFDARRHKKHFSANIRGRRGEMEAFYSTEAHDFFFWNLAGYVGFRHQISIGVLFGVPFSLHRKDLDI